MVKRQLDKYGPWRSIDWDVDGSDPLEVLRSFCLSLTLWEMTCFLRADWRIVPNLPDDFYSHYLLRFPRLVEQLYAYQTDLTPLSELDVSGYDLVICLQPCLPEEWLRRRRGTSFYYFLNEHDNHAYEASRRRPAPGYRAFLDHLCGATAAVDAPPARSLAFPYLRAPAMARDHFPRRSPPAVGPRVYVDARTIVHEATGDARGLWDDRCQSLVDELADSFGGELVTHHRGEAPAVMWPKNESHAAYLSAIASADYYVGLETSGRIGSVPHGQALADAASLGLVCVGSPWHVLHRMICEQTLLTRSLTQALALVTQAHETGTSAEILVHQDARLRRSFQEAPMRRLVLHQRGGLAFSDPRSALHAARHAVALRLRSAYFTMARTIGLRRHLRRLRR
jgi:hypothetical protein